MVETDKAFGRHYRVIAYSRRYHWPNAQPGTNPDASEVQEDDLVVIIRMLKIAPAHLVGHSYGGAITYHLALRHPELVRTLVLAEPVITSGRHSVAAAPSVFAGRVIRNAEATHGTHLLLARASTVSLRCVLINQFTARRLVLFMAVNH